MNFPAEKNDDGRAVYQHGSHSRAEAPCLSGSLTFRSYRFTPLGGCFPRDPSFKEPGQPRDNPGTVTGQGRTNPGTKAGRSGTTTGKSLQTNRPFNEKAQMSRDYRYARRRAKPLRELSSPNKKNADSSEPSEPNLQPQRHPSEP